MTLYRSLDHFQRARMADGWLPPTAAELDRRRTRFGPGIDRLASRYGIPANWVHAIIEVESGYDHRAVSRAGALGLMQLMPKTAERFGVVDPLDPTQNIKAGVQYLRVLQREFHSLDLVLAAYNAGEKAVRQYHGQVPPYAETRAYVERVLAVIDRERPSTSK